MGAIAGVAYNAATAALRVEFDSMTEYKKMVDGLLDDLTGSDADHRKLADGKLPVSKLGKGFTEVDTLFTSYGKVIDQLQDLSKGLAAQIEALGIAVLSAGKGYGGVDEETKRRLVAIASEAKAQYVKERDPLWVAEQRRREASGEAHPGATPTPSPSTSGGSYS
ncbi:hypothetical protein DEJ51_12295 [Streptomyces venezuelae]|uniref:Uncharacterized protein n=2 Tax=Streptomyces venezuelae TaxID=54571 RepID=A0A5P2DK16_STRVZ|nr:hypothetical protein DEJ51_12295 [Streptomyces venezuelae]